MRRCENVESAEREGPDAHDEGDESASIVVPRDSRRQHPPECNCGDRKHARADEISDVNGAASGSICPQRDGEEQADTSRSQKGSAAFHVRVRVTKEYRTRPLPLTGSRRSSVKCRPNASRKCSSE